MVTGSPWAASHPRGSAELPVLQLQPRWNAPTGTQHPGAALPSHGDGGPAASEGARRQAQPILRLAERWVHSLCCPVHPAGRGLASLRHCSVVPTSLATFSRSGGGAGLSAGAGYV